MILSELSWFYLALIQIFLAAGVWLILHEAQTRGASNQYALFVYFVFLILIIMGWHIINRVPLAFPPLFWSGILVLGGAAAATSNLLVLYSFAKSPNPGFSLGLAATQTLWVAFVGFLFFHSAFTLLSVAGIFFIWLGVFLIHGWESKTSFTWGMLALVSALAATFYWSTVKLASMAVPGLSPSVILLLVVLPQLIIFTTVRLPQLALARVKTLPLICLLALGGLVGALNNLMGITAVLKAPNPGYPLAIVSANTLVVVFASRLFFKSSLQSRYVFATMVIVIGIALIRIGSL